jgi:hypothetical protein
MSRFSEIIGLAFGIMFLLVMVGIIINLFILIGDTFTLRENIDTKIVNCYDKNDNYILNVTCQENISCSRLGLAGDIKCKETSQ